MKSTTSWSIRPMTFGDYDAMIELWQSIEGLQLNAADSRPGLAAFLARNPGLSMVALCAGRVVGTALCGDDGRAGYIHRLVIAPSLRETGIDRALVAECIEQLHQLGLAECHLVTASGQRSLRWDLRSGEHRLPRRYLAPVPDAEGTDNGTPDLSGSKHPYRPSP